MSILQRFPLGLHFPTQEPFLFCAHHLDHYPEGNEECGIETSKLGGRALGSDFEAKDGFRMYHGQRVPGFPVHPHRGFETITLVRKGYVDHADSLGAAGRYGMGDVQWMTAGSGIQHSEMFPLLFKDQKNTVELFQIWLNLPAKSKKSPAHFTMFWAENIPTVVLENGAVEVQIISGQFENQKGLQAPPDSWASDSVNGVRVLLVKMKTGAALKVPKVNSRFSRALYLFEGDSLKINQDLLPAKTGSFLKPDEDLSILSSSGSEFLFLEAAPIGEPIVQHGPFVMNTKEQIVETISEYRRTQFGGWPWSREDMIHGNKIERFAKFPNGMIERPKTP